MVPRYAERSLEVYEVGFTSQNGTFVVPMYSPISRELVVVCIAKVSAGRTFWGQARFDTSAQPRARRKHLDIKLSHTYL
jgi:hypothetical protein